MRNLIFSACLLASPALACSERSDLAVRLYEMDMRLVSWGLTASGDMHELFMDDAGLWAVLSTNAMHCTRLISAPTHHFERLNESGNSNPMMRMNEPLQRGPSL